MTGEEALALAKSYVRRTLEGEGAVRGVPCEIDNIEEQTDDIIVTFRWQDKDGTIHHQEMNVPKPKDSIYSTSELVIGQWVDGKPIYRKVIELTDPTLFPKGTAFKASDLPANFKMLVKGYGIIKTYENSYSNNDILVYSTSTSIMVKQNFTGYAHKMWIIIEYIKED